MPVIAVAAVLVAALLHASWNAIVRFKGDRIAVLALMTGSSGLISLIVLPFVPVPVLAAWPWLVASMVLHIGYNSFLASAYNHGDLGRVYPLARGTAPLITLIVGTYGLGEALSPHAVVGILLLGCGIAALALEQGWRVLRNEPRAVVLSLVTSLFISAYSITDGIGARTSGSAIGYIFYLFALDGLPLALFVLTTRRRATVEVIRLQWLAGCAAGMLSLGAYGIVIWAMTLAPIALVAGLRETSVLFALAIGIVFLGERLSTLRIAASLVVLSGLILTRL